jgi:predicted ATPase/DNA-binding XRE family transcriptional regulator
VEGEPSFGIWLRKQRRALDLSRQAFADQVGCAEVTLRRIEAGTLKPSQELASILLEKLGIPGTEQPQWVAFARGTAGLPTQSTSVFNKPITNLPASLTTFIGREKEQSEVIQLITKHRLVTLTGSGGVGKSRLSIKVGEQLLGDYANGVWLLELASLSDPVLLPQTAATLFGLTTQSNLPFTDLLINFLRAKTALLIFDNCEHLLDGCAHLIEALLKHCPQLKILATSREPLDIMGEAIYRVPSLEFPDLEQAPDALRDFESVALFEARAQLVQFDFSLTPENASSVAQICKRLDGIPLAIELAAAKIGVLSIEQIAKQLDESFNLLSGGSRTALPRHQTLRASINWSWNLLTESEQVLMRQLSAFAGGWTLEASQSVCDGDVLYLLNSLVTKSLIVMNQRTENNARYSFHETIRQYAREKLLEAGGNEVVRNKHLVYFVKLAEQAERALYRSSQVFWLNKLEDELDNIRLALEWALTTDAKSGLRLMVSQQFFWDMRGDTEQVGGWLAQLLEQYNYPDSLRVQALVLYGGVLISRGDLTEAQKIINQSLELSRAISDQAGEALSLWSLGTAISFQGNFKEGLQIVEQSLTLFQSLGDKLGQALAMGWLSQRLNDLKRSKVFVSESLRLYRELGHLFGIAECLRELALRTIWEGDFSSTIPLLEEAHTIYRQLGNKWGEAEVLASYGTLAYWKGDYQQAYVYHKESFELHETLGNYYVASWAGVNMAYALLRQGGISKATEIFQLWLQRSYQSKDIDLMIYTLEGLASLYVNQAQFERAARLFAWTNMMRVNLDNQNPPVEQNSIEHDLMVIHAQLYDEEFAKFSEEGRAMTIEQAITLALEPVEET